MPMRNFHAGQPIITDEELNALLGEDVRVVSITDTWFKYRNFFLLAVVISQVIKLLLFSHLTTGNFELGALDPEAFEHYLVFRACFIIAISAFYLFSYLKDWYFEKVSLLFVGIAITALVMDYFNAYVYLSENPLQWMTGLIALRILAVGCLLINALHAHRAPEMPRQLWS
jgi:uncharacterized membrane protein